MTALLDDLQMIMLNSLESLLQIIGYEEDFNEDDTTKSLRLLAVRWACRLGLKECKNAALSKLMKHLNQPYIPYV